VFNQSLVATAVPEMHDRLIVATAMYLHIQGDAATILTKDSSIVTAALIPVVW